MNQDGEVEFGWVKSAIGIALALFMLNQGYDKK
jgi:hypothetical protein